MCWVAHRTLQVRTQCVSSSFISFVQIGKERVENCLYVSRLSLDQLLHGIPTAQLDFVRKLEVLEPLTGLFPGVHPRLAVEVSLDEPHLFELGRGFVRLGYEWFHDPLQTERALIMGVLKREQPHNYGNRFQLEVMTDFLMMSVMAQKEWQDHSVLTDIKFPTSAPSFVDYCKSPFRSLAHYDSCLVQTPDSVDMQANVWGFRPLLAVALWRVFEKSSLAQKMKTIQAIRFGEPLPGLNSVHDTSVESLVLWFQDAVQSNMAALHFTASEQIDWAFKRTMKELEVEAPIHWELTVDITNTPAWKEILAQFKTWSRFHQNERTLIFTPEGAMAFPSGLPVAWGKADIQTQKHVMIACRWPKADQVVSVTARHVYARQSCGKVEDIFWN